MERARIQRILVLTAIGLTAWQAGAGTLLIPPPTRAQIDWNEDTYPESRFGKPVPRINTGIESGYASRAVEEMEGPEDDVGTRRSPAGVTTLPESTRRTHIEESMIRRTGIQEVALIANDLGYFPKTLFVNRDIPVRIFVTGASKQSLCIMMDSFQVRKQIRTSKVEEINFTPNVPGKYRFYCPVNGMEGTLVVRELVTQQE